MPNKQVFITIRSGVADVIRRPKDVPVHILDFDVPDIGMPNVCSCNAVPGRKSEDMEPHFHIVYNVEMKDRDIGYQYYVNGKKFSDHKVDMGVVNNETASMPR